MLVRTDHNRKDDGDDAQLLDDAQHEDTEQLYGGEQVNTAHWHVAQKHVVRLVLGRHEHHQHSLYELHIQQPCRYD